MSEAAITALNNLRKTGSLQWYVVPLLIFVLYVYVQEIHNRNWSVFFLSIGTMFTELIWEMFNAMFLRFSGYSPLWVTPDRSAFIIYVGFNIEIAVMFALAAILLIKTLPEDKNKKFLKIPLRFLIPVIWGLICVVVEIILNKAGLLVWEYPLWSWPHIYLILAVYVSPWIMLSWLHYNVSLKAKIVYAGIIAPIAVILHIILAVILKLI